MRKLLPGLQVFKVQPPRKIANTLFVNRLFSRERVTNLTIIPYFKSKDHSPARWFFLVPHHCGWLQICPHLQRVQARTIPSSTAASCGSLIVRFWKGIQILLASEYPPSCFKLMMPKVVAAFTLT